MIFANFDKNEKYKVVTGLWQYDYGRILRIQGLNLPTAVEIHFSLQESGGASATRIGLTKDNVTDVIIPDSMLENGDTTQNYKIYVFIYLTDATSGQTQYRIDLPITSRPKPEGFQKPSDTELFRQAIQEVNDSAKRSAESEKQAKRWAVGDSMIAGSDIDNAKYYSEQAKADATKTNADKKAVEDLVKQTANISQQVEAVKQNAMKASESEKNAKASETNAKASETNAKMSEDNAKASEENADKSAQAAGLSEQNVAGLVTGFDKKVTDAGAALDAQTNTLLKSVTDAGTAQANAVNRAGTDNVKAVNTEGTRQLDAIKKTAAEIAADRQQITQNKNDVTTLKEDLTKLQTNGNGLTKAQIDALDGMFKVTAFSEDPTSAYTTFKKAFSIGVIEPPKPGVILSRISAVYTQGNKVIYPTSSLDVLKTNLVVTAHYSDNSSNLTTDYALSGALTVGTSIITVTYQDKTTTFTVNVTANPVAPDRTLASISAKYTGGDVEVGTPLASLKGLVVTALYSDGFMEDITGYQLSGAITEGANTITVTYQNKTTTFVVNGLAVSGEVVRLKNVSFDGNSYLDTEVVPMSVKYRYVFGLQTPNKEIVNPAKNIAGVVMRDHTNMSLSHYWDIYWSFNVISNSYNVDVPKAWFTSDAMGINIRNSTGQDKGDGLSSQPFDKPLYYEITDGSQKVWCDELLSVVPTLGHFAQSSTTTKFSTSQHYDDSEHPIMPIWLGRVNNTSQGETRSLGDPENTFAGVKFYCFKVYDETNNLIADMHPAKQGTKIGMYCDVRKKFYEGKGGTMNYESVGGVA